MKAANAVVSSLKKLRGSIKAGSLRELKRAIDSSEQAIVALKQQFLNTKDGCASRTVHVVTQDGKEKMYFGIAFSKS